MAEAGFDSRAFRNALGRFSTGVTIVTTAPDGAEGTPATGGPQVHGMTANAFTSVSLDPPLLLVSIGQQSRMHTYLSQTGRFGVSVLSEDQLAYAWNFAGRPQPELQPAFVWRRNVPLVAGALAHFVCGVDASYPGGDHTLFLGRVEDLWHRDGSPLTFYRGRFFGLIPLPSGVWSPGAEATAEAQDASELSLLDPWW